MKRIYHLITIMFVSMQIASAQKVVTTATGIKAEINNTSIEFVVFNDAAIRVVKSPMQTVFTKKSLSVIAQPQTTRFSISRTQGTVEINTGTLKVSLNLQTGTVSFYDKNNKALLKEKDGSTQFKPFNDAGTKTYNVEQAYLLDENEAIYGLGQQQQGKMIQRNLKLNMIQGNTDDYVPFFLSAKGYGLFWDNYSPTVFTDNASGTSFKSDVGDCIDYYFMVGENADGVIAGMRNLTGRAPMFPLWTYGYFQSKERYKSQDELLNVVKKYRELKVPLDGIIQDWQYWGNNYLWNAMDFLNIEFPDPAKMISEVHKLNAHFTISIWNSFGPQTKQYRVMDSMGALMNFHTWPQSGSEKWPPNMDYPSGVRVYDPYNPAARDVYWKYLKYMHDLGVDGWWMDSSEPDHHDFKPSDLDNKTYLGSFRKVRNAFPLMTVGGVYDHQRAVDSAKRVFILTRSAFAGQQRYGANTWSGDVIASWTALRNQISAGLNFSLTGIPYWNSDIGGFFVWNFKRQLKDPEYRELYLRWLQFGTFCPMMRSHGADAPREIYNFGKAGDRDFDAIDKYIKLRYQLLPYIYSTSWDVTTNNSSMMRALVMDFANDKNALDINDEYMFGKSILVNPVTEPMYVKQVVQGKDTLMLEDFSSTKSKDVYLPAGSNWFDFWTNEKFTGGKTVTKETPVDVLPLFVKAGSILPFGPAVQYANEKKWDELEIRIYAGANGNFVLYEDENDNYNYEKGVFSTTNFNWNDKTQTITIGERKGEFPGMLQTRKFKINLISKTILGSEKVVTYAGEKLTIKL